MRLLGVWAPDVPTMREAGFSINTTDWDGLFAPAGIAPDRLTRISSSFDQRDPLPGGRGSPPGRRRAAHRHVA
jgi:hypothetical protein